jgi:hypothetical protein
MRASGDARNAFRRAALPAAILVAVVVFLLGAAAPMALRSLSSPVAVDLPAAVRAPAVETRPSDHSTGPVIHRAESFGAAPQGRVPQPEQESRFTDVTPGRAERALGAPQLRPADPGWVARRIEVPALGVNVAVTMAATASHEDFPPFDGAYILRSSAQPGRGTNSYMFAHAMPALFKPLWGADIGQQVIVTMSDGQQLGYRVTAVVRNIPCPDQSAPKPAGLPPVLANATECDLSWTLPTATERLTLQTSQGFNRNYGEMVVIAEPDW